MARPRVLAIHEQEVREDFDELQREWPDGLVSPGGAAAMLGITRQSVHSLMQRGRIRSYRSPTAPAVKKFGLVIEPAQPRWTVIPVSEVLRYAAEVGRPVRQPPRRRVPS